MKSSIHPNYFTDVPVQCTGCGMSFVTQSTKKSISVHVCSKCHPFYTGEQKFIDTKGKVEKFQKKMEQAKVHKVKLDEKKAKKAGKGGMKETKSLRELLADI
ncbi:MAG TPA: 50S ribosomal protein L31 [Candidatus Woesebacteria bacterium]|nr:50S ribosomal protein L31 [Candidatus Woesebacteria bacterium]HNS94361.1 50S ribosomal protein L31 [Candidatus Woesebacteria bacterium]